MAEQDQATEVEQSVVEEKHYKWGATTQPSSQLREYSIGQGVSVRVRTEKAEKPVNLFVSIPGIVKENPEPILVDLKPGSIFSKVKDQIKNVEWLNEQLGEGDSPDWSAFVLALVKVIVKGANADLLTKREKAVTRVKERLQKANDALVKAESALELARKSNRELPSFELVAPEKIEPVVHRTRKAQSTSQK